MKKTTLFLLTLLLVAALCVLLTACGEEPADTTTDAATTTTNSEVTTVSTTATTATTATTTPTTTPTTPTTPAVTTTASPIAQKTPADIDVFTFDGKLDGYVIGYEAGADAAAGTLATALSLPSAAYDSAVEKCIRTAIVQDGVIALGAGDYHIYMAGKTIHIVGGDAAGLAAGVNAFAATVANGVTSHPQYLHTVFLAAAPTGTFSLSATELIGNTTDHAITAYQAGDEITFVLNLLTAGVRTGAHTFKYTLSADDCTMKVTGEIPATHGVFAITVPVEMTLIPGSVRLEVNVYDEAGTLLPSVYASGTDKAKYTYIGGCYVDAEKITSDVAIPDDFESFWSKVLRDRESPTADMVAGSKYRNGFAIYKMDADYLTATGHADQISKLADFDMYEVYLACDEDPTNGRPSIGFVSVPKNARADSLPIIVGLNSYGTRDGRLSCSTGAIIVKMHPNGLPMKYYNADTNTFTDHTYFAEDANFGKIVSDYDDPKNAYLAKMLLRNIQMLHYLTSEEYDEIAPSPEYTNLADFDEFQTLRDAYNGKIQFVGDGSMGGFQHIATAALCHVQVRKAYLVQGTVTSTAAHCPWMCDPVAVAGLTGRLMGQGTRLGQGAGTGDINELNIVNYSYFDTAHFATLIPETCMVKVTGGFADTTCPSSGLMALYNAVKGKKSIEMIQNKDHSAAYPKTQLKHSTSYTPAN